MSNNWRRNTRRSRRNRKHGMLGGGKPRGSNPDRLTYGQYVERHQHRWTSSKGGSHEHPQISTRKG